MRKGRFVLLLLKMVLLGIVNGLFIGGVLVGSYAFFLYVFLIAVNMSGLHYPGYIIILCAGVSSGLFWIVFGWADKYLFSCRVQRFTRQFVGRMVQWLITGSERNGS